MKNRIKKFRLMLLSVILIISALPIVAHATPAHTMSVVFSEAEDGVTVISLILPEATELTAIDFSVSLTSESAVIENLSTENTDITDSIYDFDNLPEESTEGECFTFTTTLMPDTLNFSGFFLNSLTTDKSFHLCDIFIASDTEFTEDDVFRFTYTLTCEKCSKTEAHTYSLLNKAISEKEQQRSFPSGDADLNGVVNSADARLILRASVGLESLGLEEAPYADSDHDGNITATDARFSLRLSVGLEQTVIHSFEISLEEGQMCEDGGNYTFTCRITGKSFTMELMNGGHLCHDTDCFNTGKCEVCNEEIHPATGHKFDENGKCSVCTADKALLDEAMQRLISLLEEINTYDTMADEALAVNRKIDFISYTQEATKIIRNAADVCNGITGLGNIEEHLMTAYNIRFQAFISVMDENGQILSSSGNCSTILSAVKQSNVHIDYASYLYE